MIPGLLDALEGVRACLDSLVIEDLPSVPIDGEDWNKRLESVSGIYFIRSQSKGLLYIGKAGNLRRRWRRRNEMGDADKDADVFLDDEDYEDDWGDTVAPGYDPEDDWTGGWCDDCGHGDPWCTCWKDD